MKKLVLLLSLFILSLNNSNAQNPTSEKSKTAENNSKKSTQEKEISKQDDDNDGILNNADACPLEKGTIANNGCPEVQNASDTTPARKEELMALYHIGFPVTTALKTRLVFSKNKLKADARAARNTDGYKVALEKYRSTIINYHDSCAATIVKWKNYMSKEAKHLTAEDKENQLVKITALEVENAEERKELDAKFPSIEK